MTHFQVSLFKQRVSVTAEKSLIKSYIHQFLSDWPEFVSVGHPGTECPPSVLGSVAKPLRDLIDGNSGSQPR